LREISSENSENSKRTAKPSLIDAMNDAIKDVPNDLALAEARKKVDQNLLKTVDVGFI